MALRVPKLAACLYTLCNTTIGAGRPEHYRTRRDLDSHGTRTCLRQKTCELLTADPGTGPVTHESRAAESRPGSTAAVDFRAGSLAKANRDPGGGWQIAEVPAQSHDGSASQISGAFSGSCFHGRIAGSLAALRNPSSKPEVKVQRSKSGTGVTPPASHAPEQQIAWLPQASSPVRDSTTPCPRVAAYL